VVTPAAGSNSDIAHGFTRCWATGDPPLAVSGLHFFKASSAHVLAYAHDELLQSVTVAIER